jgi:dihydrofolate reductase
MRRLVVSEFVTLDGVIEDPGGSEGFEHGGWSFRFPDPEAMRFKLEEVMAADALLLGRITYEGFAAAWPGRTDEAGFAAKMNSMAKYVASSSLAQAAWTNSTVISGDVPAEIARLKQDPGGDILVAGSRTLVHTLAEHDLVDEYRLMVHPIVLGSGKRLFDGPAGPTVLRLVSARPLASGTIIAVYEPVPH